MSRREYHHFTIEALAGGVYAAVATDEGGLICNAAIVDLGSTTLVFDTGATLPAAQELRATAQTLTGHPVTYVVNSHGHPDHIHGNAVFPEATTIASHMTRTEIADDGLRWMEQMRGEPAGRLEGYPTPADLSVPTLSFDGQLTFHGETQTAQLIACGPAHSKGDTVLWLPEPGILFTGDLITDGNLILCYGSPETWLEVLDHLQSLSPRLIVPGHGRIAPAEAAITRGQAYIRDLLNRVAQAPSESAAEGWPVPEGCGEHWFRANLHFLFNRR